MKKVKIFVVLLLSIILLGACKGSNNGTKDGENVSSGNSVATVKVKDATYVVPKCTDQYDPDSDEGYLAINIELKNTSKESLDITRSDFSLYDKNDDKVSQENFYTDDSSFKTFEYDKLSKEKSKTGYVVFKINKKQKYELHYEPAFYDVGSSKKPKEIVLKLDTSKYKDESSKVTDVAKAYVNTILLNKDDENYDKLIANNKEKEKETFTKPFMSALKNDFDYYDPTTEELTKIIAEFQKKNGEVAQVDYQVESYYPDAAVIIVKPKVITFEELDDEGKAVVNKFIDENKDKDYDDYDQVYKDAEKYLIDHYTEIFKNASATEVSNYDDGYKISLKKIESKWEVNTSTASSNYSFTSLLEAFRGGLYN